MKRTIKILFFLALFLSIVLIRLFAFDVYKIPSRSMTPSLIPGDYTLVSKLNFGPRVINVFKLIFSQKAQYVWFKGFEHIKKDDIIVFNLPNYEGLIDSTVFIYGTCLIKRCYGTPGDTVRIKSKELKLINSNINFNNIFPYDTTLHWNLENYGPLYIPKKGDTMLLTPSNATCYKDVLLYESKNIEQHNESVLQSSNIKSRHIFKYNYYFMVGDNFYQSRDSRYWGLLPETHIIGKAVLVLFSLDQEAPWYRQFRWERLLKGLNYSHN